MAGSHHQLSFEKRKRPAQEEHEPRRIPVEADIGT